MRLSVMILCICTCTCAFAQEKEGIRAALSADVTRTIMNHELAFGFSHAFSEHWSAGAGASFRLPQFRKITGEEAEHEALLSDREEDISGDSPGTGPEFRIGVRFWPEKFSRGSYCGIGCSENSGRGSPDMIVEIGYAMSVFRFICITAGYEIHIREAFNEGTFGTKGIRIRINYTF